MKFLNISRVYYIYTQDVILYNYMLRKINTLELVLVKNFTAKRISELLLVDV